MTVISEKLVFKNRAGEELAGTLDRPVGTPTATALFAHCFTCTKDLPASGRISRELAARGFAVLRFDFTGLGSSDGDFANSNFTSNVDDLERAAEALAERMTGPRLLVGHSLGGAAVLAVARRIESVEAVATIAAPADPAHVKNLLVGDAREIEEQGEAEVDIGGRPFRIRRQFLEDLDSQRSGAELGDLDAALLVMHGPLDKIVSISNAERIYKAARGFKSFVSLADADHLLGRASDARYAAEVLAAWASRYVSGDEPTQSEAREGHVLVEELERPYTNRVVARQHGMLADEPRSAGAHDAGPTPYEYLLAALGSCTSMTLRMYADHKGWPLEHVSVSLSHSKVHAQECASCEQQDGKVDRIQRELRITGPELDDSQRARLLEIADRCPVHRTLMGEKEILT
ncbi:MAG: bifunctional alpha/beta hydrolase/OsmC family protein, partial [Planctomycetota bacterium]